MGNLVPSGGLVPRTVSSGYLSAHAMFAAELSCAMHSHSWCAQSQSSSGLMGHSCWCPLPPLFSCCGLKYLAENSLKHNSTTGLSSNARPKNTLLWYSMPVMGEKGAHEQIRSYLCAHDQRFPPSEVW